MAALRAQFRAFVDANLSPSARSAMLADMARQMRADLVASGRAVQESITYVDGRPDADESQVRGDGTGQITYRFNYMVEASQWALAFLRAWAPVRTGAFRDSFYLGINGRFVPAAQFVPAVVPYDAEVVIGNLEPYSRKIDVQMAGQRPLRYSVPAGMFDACATAVQRRFGRTVLAKRVYSLSFPGQYRLRRGAHTGDIVNSPAVILTPQL